MSGVEFQRCRDCGRCQSYLRALCKHCGSRELEVVEGSGLGTVFATTVVHRSSQEELAASTPYPLTLVRMEEGPMLMALVLGEAGDFPAGAAVAVDVEATRGRGLLTVSRR
jgi:uncharacterized protein